MGECPYEKGDVFKILKNKIIFFLSERLIIAQEIDHIFYLFSTHHWRMFDIVRERSVFIT